MIFYFTIMQLCLCLAHTHTHLDSHRSGFASSPVLDCSVGCIWALSERPGRASLEVRGQRVPSPSGPPGAAGTEAAAASPGWAAPAGRPDCLAVSSVVRAAGCGVLWAGLMPGSSRDAAAAAAGAQRASCSRRCLLAKRRRRGSAWFCRRRSPAPPRRCVAGWGLSRRWACGRPAAAAAAARSAALCLNAAAAAAELQWTPSPHRWNSYPAWWKRCWPPAARWRPRWSLAAPGWWQGGSREPPGPVLSWSAAASAFWGYWACRGLCGGGWCWGGWGWCWGCKGWEFCPLRSTRRPRTRSLVCTSFRCLWRWSAGGCWSGEGTYPVLAESEMKIAEVKL